MRAMPAASADVEAYAVSRKPLESMIERLHTHLLEFFEFS